MKRFSLLSAILSLAIFAGCEYSMKGVLDDLTQPTTFIVTYDKNAADAGDVPGDPNEYKEGNIVTVLDNEGNLVKTGVYYAGWNTAPDGSGTNYTVGQTFNIGRNNVTLYARWSNNPVYRITYDSNGADSGIVPVDNTFYENGVNATIPGNTGDLVKTNYSFIGWNTKADGTGTNYTQGATYTMGNENVTLYANWTAGKTFTVTYIAPNPGSGTVTGTVPVDSITYLPNATVIVCNNTGNLELPGYVFNGWNTATDGSGESYQAGDMFGMPANNVILYSMWSADTIKVTFDYQGGSGLITDKITTFNSVYGSLPAAARTGYNFGGWYTEQNGKGNKIEESSTVTITSDHKLYAYWGEYTYRVTYDQTGVTTPSEPTYKDVESPNITVGSLPGVNPTKSGYNFAGWYTGTNGLGIQFISTTTVTNSITVYACWTIKPVYNVSFNTDGGSAIGDISVKGDDVIIRPSNPSKTGYTFGDWYEDFSKTIVWNFNNKINQNTILYAMWTANTYTVMFDFQSGSGSPSSKTVTYDSIYGTLASASRTGYTFGGWYTGPNGTGTLITSGTTVAITTDQILFAKWTANQYVVTFDRQLGSYGTDSVAATYGSAMPAATAPSRTGYNFGGYWDQPIGGNQYYDVNMSSMRSWDKTGASTLYAHWVATVNYNLRDTGPAGGLIFYINPNAARDGWKYLEVSSTEWTGKQWGKRGTLVGGTGRSIGTGKNNTVLIVAKLNQPTADTDRAAQLCDSLSISYNNKTYDDWFLPSIDELSKMYINLKTGTDEYGVSYTPVGILNYAYWSSSEESANWVYVKNSDGSEGNYAKDVTFVRFRAIRSF